MNIELRKDIVFDFLKKNKFRINKDLVKILFDHIRNSLGIVLIYPPSSLINKSFLSILNSIKNSWLKLTGGEPRKKFICSLTEQIHQIKIKKEDLQDSREEPTVIVVLFKKTILFLLFIFLKYF